MSSGRTRDKFILSPMAFAMRAKCVLMIEGQWVKRSPMFGS